jgi:hypothetical protein
MSHSSTAFRCGVAVAAIAGVAAAAAAVPLVVEPAGGRTNWFAGREATLGTLIRGGAAVEGKLVWVLAVASRTLATGAADVRHTAVGETRQDVTVAIPEGRMGVVVEAEFAAALVDAAGTRLGSCSRRVRIFPTDPFADRKRWLESLEIAVIDPQGETETVLTAAGVPFESVGADAGIAALESRLVIVGEGTSWVEHPRLPRDLAAVAARGASVLCLAPRDGSMPVPGSVDAPGEVVATSLVARRADVIADLDDRLDACDWSAASETVISRLVIAADGDTVVIRAGGEPAGWPWLEAGFARGDAAPPAGKLVVCGLGIVAHWDETPAARYLCAAILARLGERKPGAELHRHSPPPAAPPKEDDR